MAKSNVLGDEEYPPRADLRRDVYKPFPAVPSESISLDVSEAAKIAAAYVASFNEAFRSADAARLANLIFSAPEQTFWRDLLSLTYHFRTFNDRGVIAPAFLELGQARGLSDWSFVEGSVVFIPAAPKLVRGHPVLSAGHGDPVPEEFPAATCSGRVALVPEHQDRESGQLEWKIWHFSTWLERFNAFAPDKSRLEAPGMDLTGLEDVETDVFIIGGGNAGIITAARLKELGVESLIVDKYPQVGDNWAKRYDCLRFHLTKTLSDPPYLSYPDDVPQLPRGKDLAEHMRRYAATFKLNILNSTTIKWTTYDPSNKRWKVVLNTPNGEKTVVAKSFVQATGVGSSKPYVPDILNKDLYEGINIHSVQFKSGTDLRGKGAKSVIIVGSANTAFDLVEDCHDAGVQTTIVARSPTFIFPWEYSLSPKGLGQYEILPAEVVDNRQIGAATSIAGQLARAGMAELAAKEPERYAALAKAGFPVYDAADPRADLTHHIRERTGGHYNEIGNAVKYISEGKVAVKGNVTPTAFTATGLLFSDRTTVDADAIVWCTGFADSNVREIAAEILGGGSSDDGNWATENGDEVLGPHDIAARLDGTWGVDAEGELRGMWKRHLKMENFWVVGSTASMQRFYSRFTALQIKGVLEGILPEAYRDTPALIG